MPVTVKPLPSAATFLLDLTASNTAVEWEQVDDRIRDLDQELKVRSLLCSNSPADSVDSLSRASPLRTSPVDLTRTDT